MRKYENMTRHDDIKGNSITAIGHREKERRNKRGRKGHFKIHDIKIRNKTDKGRSEVSWKSLGTECRLGVVRV